MREFKNFFENSFGLIEAIVCVIIGVALIIIDVCTPPVVISTLTFGGILTFIGIIGIILSLTSKKNK